MGGKGSGRHRKKRKKGQKHHLQGKNRINSLKKKERQAKVARIFVERPSLTHQEIGDMFGVSRACITKDLREIEQMYIEETLDNVEVAKARAIKRQEWRLKEAHDAWERSKAEQVETKTKKKESTGQQGGTEEEVQEKRKQTPGDPRFLDQFGEAAIEIAALQGVDKLDGSHNLNVNINMPDLPAEYGDFGLTPNLPEDQQKGLPAPGEDVADVEIIDESHAEPQRRGDDEEK